MLIRFTRDVDIYHAGDVRDLPREDGLRHVRNGDARDLGVDTERMVANTDRVETR